MTIQIPFDNSYAALSDAFHARLDPTPVRSAEMLAWNDALAAELGIKGTDPQVFAGNVVPEGARPIAQLYAGHQFGNFNPQLGDGRAILLGEVIDSAGKRRDIQLKGSGPTPFSRNGDGRAWLGPVLREYVVSEAMRALGIPTTRALAAVATGEPVLREMGRLPGGVITRVASSHIRVGTFQVFAHRGQVDDLRTLTEYTIARHYPDVDGPMELLAAVCKRQASLVAAWMSVGFIHGVMNTDNCAISGETIDYGPCAFMDAYHEMQVFSSIDQMGRYAFGNQPHIAVWNMAQFATALLPLFEDTDQAIEGATEIVHAMPAQFEAEWLRRFGEKIGLDDATQEDKPLIDDLLNLMQGSGSDFTNTFAALGTDDVRTHFADNDRFDAWNVRWRKRIRPDHMHIMARANPQIIPRNHQIETMIQKAVQGDMTLFDQLSQALSDPYNVPADFAFLRAAPQAEEVVKATFCGT